MRKENMEICTFSTEERILQCLYLLCLTCKTPLIASVQKYVALFCNFFLSEAKQRPSNKYRLSFFKIKHCSRSLALLSSRVNEVLIFSEIPKLRTLPPDENIDRALYTRTNFTKLLWVRKDGLRVLNNI